MPHIHMRLLQHFQTSIFKKVTQAAAMAKDMTLYWGSGSPPCWRVQLALEEKGLGDYNSKLLSFDKREHKSPELLKINPRGQLPAFTHGDIVLNESIGACEYLEERFKGQGTKLVPDDPAEKALMYQRIHEANSLMPKFRDCVFYDYFVPEDERHDSARKRNQEGLTTEVKLWEDYVKKGKGPYLVGANFSLADVVNFPMIAMLFRQGLCEKKYPALAEYYNHVKTRPTVQKSWPPTWKDTPNQANLKDI